MEGLQLDHEVKASMEKIGKDVSNQMKKLLVDLTTTGCAALEVNTMKKFKKICRDSDDHVRHAFYLILQQLKKEHSEIRLSVSQVADELFNRSHAFRETMVNNLNHYLALTTGTEASKPLPPPKPAALKMKADTLKSIQQWHDKFGQGYRKLAVAYNYLKNCKQINFNDIRARSEAEQKRLEEEERKKQRIMALRLEKVLKEISEERDEVLLCAKEAESCLQILLPTPDDFLQNVTSGVISTQCSQDMKESRKKEENDNTEDDFDMDEDDCSDIDEDFEDAGAKSLQVHGLPMAGQSITVDLGQADMLSVKETKDNEDVVRSLKETSKIISSSYLPKVTVWLEILGKNGAKETDIKAAIDLKVHLQSVKQKCVELNLVPMETERLKNNDSDEEDFEDVPEKEGYEPRIPSHLREEYGLDKYDVKEALPSSKTTQRPSSASCSSSSQNSWQWNLTDKLKKENIKDPTSLAAAMARIKPESLSPERISSSLPSQSEESKSKVPVVQFGEDLAFWENPEEMKAPSIIKFDSLHRFWTPKEAEAEKPSQHDIAALRNRAFTFTGKFEPVKWKCRAPLQNGKLCERMDRYKCPFHGEIIARDEHGNPQKSEATSTTDIKQEGPSTSEDSEVIPPWKDPELQREIENATGHDLGSERSQKELNKKIHGKGKGKGKGKKTSNLTDINASKNTVRKRIEDKIFSKRSVKRVCATLDSADFRRVRDKFGNQFNYSLH